MHLTSRKSSHEESPHLLASGHHEPGVGVISIGTWTVTLGLLYPRLDLGRGPIGNHEPPFNWAIVEELDGADKLLSEEMRAKVNLGA